MSPRMGRTGGAAARGFGKGTAVRGPRGIPSVVSATAVGTVENASNGKLNLTWTNTDATSQTRIYNGGTLLATANAAATTYEVTTLNANTAYTLTVKHYKDSIESAGANFSQATTYAYNGANESEYCSGCDRRRSYANGNNGTTDYVIEEYYQACGGGYSCCRPYGQLVNEGCFGDYGDLYIWVYSNGTCFVYEILSEHDCVRCAGSPGCGG